MILSLLYQSRIFTFSLIVLIAGGLSIKSSQYLIISCLSYVLSTNNFLFDLKLSGGKICIKVY